MDTTTRTNRRRLATQGGAAVAGLALSGVFARMAAAQEATPITAADSATAEENLALFDRLDFEAWNNRDWDLFRQLHADDVHVEGGGQTTDGIEAHLAWAQAVVAQVPDSKVLAHPIRIGAGDWIAVTGLLPDGSTVATIARWENGQIAEEYLFSLMSGPADAGSGTPTA
ncbi:MAG TPA: nuclear transport factor 2 family protein [Acidimicrobiia bacterium]|nr:nuclear transport factor 2 family protein [Acidimicrobiia bacterium]